MKSPWESRVGKLLDPETYDEFLYSYKPVDGLHGGQPKIDWFACDKTGRFWLIEVKWLAENRRSINLETDVTAGQREGLTAVASSEQGVALLAVGQGTTLSIFDWREVISWSTRNYPNPLLPIGGDLRTIRLRWTGPKTWNHPLYEYVIEWLINPTEQSRRMRVKQSPGPGPFRWISKPKGSTPILPLMRPLEP
jgi:hypothetical protein